ncbi:MAG: zeta toxin family protein [Sulfurimonas sp.]|nr:zeta toxin family protein [Sulfurimonas sp.]
MNLYIVAGANGSGKTTFAKDFSFQNDISFVNADEIAASMQENNIQAGKIFLQTIKKHLAERQDFIMETTLSGRYIVKIIEKAKKLGYETTLFYLFLETPEINIARVKNRVLKGGHNIPTEDIIRRFYRSRKLFWNLYKQKVDSWYLFYNSDDEFEEIANSQDGIEMVYDEFLFEKLKESR